MTPTNYAHLRMRLANKGLGEFRAEGNTIWLYETIASDRDEAAFFGGVDPQTFIAALAEVNGPVTLRINSPGGSVFGAQAMVAAMRAHPHPITARVDALAASAASVIAANCARCVMVPGAKLMIHKAWGLVVGNADDLRGTADLLDKIDGDIAADYAARTGAAGEGVDWIALMAAETWFTAQEALAAGLADEVDAQNTQRPANRWDLSAFAAALPIDPPEVEPLPPEPAAPAAAATAAARDRARAWAQAELQIAAL